MISCETIFISSVSALKSNNNNVNLNLKVEIGTPQTSTMSSSPTPSLSCDDYISTEELFQSFMEVAFIAEQELKNNRVNSTSSSTEIKDAPIQNTDTKHILSVSAPFKDEKINNNNAVLMPLPLMLKKSSDPIYECIADDFKQQHQQRHHQHNHTNIPAPSNTSMLNEQVKPSTSPPHHYHKPTLHRTVSDTNSDSGTIVTVSASPNKNVSTTSTINHPTPDYPGAVEVFTKEPTQNSNNTGNPATVPGETNSDYDSIIQYRCEPIHDIYAVVNKKKNMSAQNNLQKQQDPSTLSPEELLLSPTHENSINSTSDETNIITNSSISKSDTYETISSMTPSPIPVTDSYTVETKIHQHQHLSLYSDYAIIESPPPAPRINGAPRRNRPSSQEKNTTTTATAEEESGSAKTPETTGAAEISYAVEHNNTSISFPKASSNYETIGDMMAMTTADSNAQQSPPNNIADDNKINRYSEDSNTNAFIENSSNSSNYETVEDLKLGISNQGLITLSDSPATTPGDGELSPEIIAFGFHSARLQTESHVQMNKYLSTIDRSARNSDKKKHFFGFGKHKSHQFSQDT